MSSHLVQQRPGRTTWVATAGLAYSGLGLLGAVWFAPSGDGAAFSLVFFCYAAVGWLVATRRSSNNMGWLLLAFAGIGATHGVLWAWSAAAAAWDWPGLAVARWSQSWLWAPVLGLVFGPLLASFPDGRLLSRRWRPVLWLAGVFIVLAGTGNALYPHPVGDSGPNPYALHGAEPLLDAMRNVGGIALMLSLAGGVAALIVRYRRGDAVQRRQMKWFLAAATLLPVATVVGELEDQALQPVAIPVALALLAAAIGIAILRHGLYDIDRIISRSVSWALVTVVVGAVYLGAVTLLTSITAGFAGESTIAVAAATLLAAAAFRPARSKIQSVVDRRFNRARYDALQTVDEYRLRLRDDLDVDSIAGHLQGVAVSALQPEQSLLWLRAPEVSA